jgi:SAM-dependent methyltransferase
MMTREAAIRRHFNREMKLIELGPSYAPILAKGDGWNTVVVDHATQAELVAKYTGLDVATVDRIEPVDFVWQDGPLSDLIPRAMHGTFDGLVASHVGEHFPDLVAFLKDAAILLKPDGILALALPDKRGCFDFFQPITMIGDVLGAHAERRTRHLRRNFINQAAYFTMRGEQPGWVQNGTTSPFLLRNDLALAQCASDMVDDRPDAPYSDTHAWTLTPKSFELLILELNLLRHIEWAVQEIEPSGGVEFHVWLHRERIELPADSINPMRLGLLTEMMYETRDAIAQLDAAAGPPPPVLTAAAAASRDFHAAAAAHDTAAMTSAREQLIGVAQDADRQARLLLIATLQRYKAALLEGNTNDVVVAWTEVMTVVVSIPHISRRLRATLGLLRNPMVARTAFALRRIARPAMLWAFRA